jgi:hypothetical protein
MASQARSMVSFRASGRTLQRLDELRGWIAETDPNRNPDRTDIILLAIRRLHRKEESRRELLQAAKDAAPTDTLDQIRARARTKKKGR